MNSNNQLTYYSILELEPNCTKHDIDVNYKKLALKYHPDKPDGDAVIFDLINQAYTTLGNQENRREYDKFLNNDQNNEELDPTHQTMKSNFENFMTTVSKTTTKPSNKIKSTETITEKQISTHEMAEKLSNKELERKQEEIEYTSENIFGNRPFDPVMFNKVFETHKENTEIIKKEANPLPWNLNTESSQASFTEEQEEPVNDLFDTYFGKQMQPTKEELEKVKNIPTKTENPKEIQQKIAERLAEHAKIENEFKNKKVQFITEMQDPTLGGYGITASIKQQLEQAKKSEEIKESKAQLHSKCGKLLKYETKSKKN